MEENQAEVKHELDIEPDIVKDDLNTPLVKEKLKSNVRALRNSVIACYHISCGIFFGVMTYFAISLILSTFFSELSVMFGTGANAISLGFSSFVGFIFYAFIIGIALIPIAIAFMYRNGRVRYVSVLKGANKENMEIVFARLEFVALLIGEIIFDFLMFCAIVICFTNNMTIIGILLCVTLVVAFIFLALVIADLVRNRVAYNKLTDEEKEEIKEKIKSFRKKKVKRERKRNAGKLY